MRKYRLIITIILVFIPSMIWGQEKLSADDYFIEGMRHFLSGEMDKADKLFDNCIKLDNKHDAAFYYKSMIALNNSDEDKGLKYLSTAHHLNPENSWYTITLARFYTLRDEMEMSIKLYEELIEKNPNKSSNYYEIIEVYGYAKQYDKALEALDKIELIQGGADPTTADFRYELLLRKGDNEKASEHLLNYFNENPTDKHAFLLGEEALSSYNDSLAASYYNTALEFNPEFGPAHYGLSQVSLMRNQINDFFFHIDKLIRAEDVSLEFKINLLNNEIITPDFVRAFKPNVDSLISALLQTYPSDTITYSIAANYNVAIGENEKGLELNKKSMELNPSSLYAHYDYISQLYRLSMYDEAIKQGIESLKLFPTNEGINEIVALSYWQKNDYEKAIERYLYILTFLEKEHPMIIYCYSSLGDLYFKLNQSKTAFKYYEMALEINKDHLPVLNNYAYYLSLTGKKLKKALDMSQKTIDAQPDNPTYLDTYGWILHLLGDNQSAKKYIKLAIINGSKQNADVIDHYAEILFALGEYDLAFLYWSDAHKLDPSLGIDKKITEKQNSLKRK
ncbi:MAG: tetratricopeptide repeat protein [Bacteroidales bacterium]|nr:tetratricopeptide repeat protein [Bacteroidales bacterium]